MGLVAALAAFYAPLVFGYGYARFNRSTGESTRHLSRLILYFFLPLLIFSSICSRCSHGDIRGYLRVTLVAIAGVLLTAAVARAVFKGEAEALIPSFYPNAGYLPIPLAYALWGVDAIPYVCFYILGSSSTANFLAPLAAGGGVRAGLRRLCRYPPIYAIVAAALTVAAGFCIPLQMLEVAQRLGVAAPPLALVVLGMEAARLKGVKAEYAKVAFIRHVVSPALIVPLALAMGIRGLPLLVVALESLMPPAVTSVVLASEFGLSTSRVAGYVATSTLVATLLVIPVYATVVMGP